MRAERGTSLLSNGAMYDAEAKEMRIHSLSRIFIVYAPPQISYHYPCANNDFEFFRCDRTCALIFLNGEVSQRAN